MNIEREQPDWSEDLFELLWFHIGNFLSVNDIDRLSQTSQRLKTLFTSNDFWSYLIRVKFGSIIWHRFVKNSLLQIDETKPFVSRSKSIYTELCQRHCISFADLDQITLDTNRNYTTVNDPSSFSDQVLHIRDSIEFSYALFIEVMFKNLLPGRYDVIIRMKLDLPYMLGETEFIAAADQINPGEIAHMKWTEEDFLSMYRCFNCDLSKTNLWFYQQIGVVEIRGNERCNVFVSIMNQDPIHAKHGVYLDYVELKLRSE